MKGLTMFDSVNVLIWSKQLNMWLMRKKRNHFDREDKPARPHNNAPDCKPVWFIYPLTKP